MRITESPYKETADVVLIHSNHTSISLRTYYFCIIITIVLSVSTLKTIRNSNLERQH